MKKILSTLFIAVLATTSVPAIAAEPAEAVSEVTVTSSETITPRIY